MPSRPYIAVVGAGQASEQELEVAGLVGAHLGVAGALLVCGGEGGVMAAACAAAQGHGGSTLGLLPGTDRSTGNAHLDVAVPTGMGEMRNALVVRAADAVIAIGGGYGTLSEVALALKTGVPVVGLGTWKLEDPAGAPAPVHIVEDAADAVALALELASG